MDYKQLIQNWHNKASDEDYFSKFTFEYMAFIAYLMTQWFPYADNERKAIQELKRNSKKKKDILKEVMSLGALTIYLKVNLMKAHVSEMYQAYILQKK